jgi:hypothetical protein
LNIAAQHRAMPQGRLTGIGQKRWHFRRCIVIEPARAD